MLHACAGAHRNLAGVPLAYHVSGNATRAIAGYFRLAAIGVNQARANVGIGGGKKPFHAVSAYAVVAIANAFAEFMQVGRSISAIHDQKIISASGSFSEREFHPSLCQTRERFPDDSVRLSGATDSSSL